MQQGSNETTRIETLMNKCRSDGFDALSQEEAAEIFLSFAAFSSDARPLRDKITDGEPCSFFELSQDELKRRGDSDAAIFLIKSFPEIASRCLGKCMDTDKAASSRKSRAEKERSLLETMLVNKFIGADVEKVLLALFRENGDLVYFDFVGKGSNTSSFFDEAKICALASSHSARCAVIAHNHPSGCVLPSAADCKTTASLFSRLGSLGVLLIDHYIVTRSKCVSIRESYDFTNRDKQYLTHTINRLKAEYR